MSDYLVSVAQVWGLDSKRCVLRTIRYVLRGLCRPLASTYWTSAIRSNPVLRYWCRHSPRLCIKPTRPYLNRDYSITDRIRLIEAHYQLINDLLNRSSVESLALGAQVVLAEFSGKNESRYRVYLRKTNKFDREGELCLVLQDAVTQRSLYFLVFSLNCVEASRRLEIGCLQGSNEGDAQASIRQATRACFGLRPKKLLMEVVYGVAECWRIDAVYGVSNARRVFNSRQTRADYDGFWRELGGEIPKGAAMFHLPRRLRRLAITEIESKHRSEYRKKSLLLGSLEAQVLASLGRLGLRGGRDSLPDCGLEITRIRLVHEGINL